MRGLARSQAGSGARSQAGSVPPHLRTPPSHIGSVRRQPARGRSPRFCPRSTAYGRLRSGGSTGLGASACPARRMPRPKYSHQHTARGIFSGPQGGELTSAESPASVPSRAAPSAAASAHPLGIVARVTINPGRVWPCGVRLLWH